MMPKTDIILSVFRVTGSQVARGHLDWAQDEGVLGMEPSDILDQLNTLGRVRQRSGLTQEQLAEKSGVPVATIRRLERGIGIPNLSTASKLANVLGTDVHAIQYGRTTI